MSPKSARSALWRLDFPHFEGLLQLIRWIPRTGGLLQQAWMLGLVPCKVIPVATSQALLGAEPPYVRGAAVPRLDRVPAQEDVRNSADLKRDTALPYSLMRTTTQPSPSPTSPVTGNSKYGDLLAHVPIAVPQGAGSENMTSGQFRMLRISGS